MRGTFSRHRITVCSAFILLPCFALGQQPNSDADHANTGNLAAMKNVSATDSEEKAPKLTEEQELAYQTLEASEGASRGFDAPMRSYGLLETGSALATLDTQKALAL